MQSTSVFSYLLVKMLLIDSSANKKTGDFSGCGNRVLNPCCISQAAQLKLGSAMMSQSGHRLVFIWLLSLAVISVCACKSSRTADHLRESLFGTMDVPAWVDTFWERKGRLPNDYPELVAFVAKRTQGEVQLKDYPRVDFSLLPSGQRHADFYSVVNGATNVTSRATWGKPKEPFR
jgi:hypothetical protein